MDNKTLGNLKEAVHLVEKALVNKKYSSIGSSFIISRLTKSEIIQAIDEYVGQLTLAPDSFYKNLEFVEIKDSNPKQWAVDFDLWFDGKQSDLTLSLTIKKTIGDKYLVKVDNLHVL